MIPLHPVTDVDHACPHCHVRLGVKGWYIPGMRNLAELACSQCGREFYGDLPAGHGLHYPMLLEKATGVVHDRVSVPWFSEWLYASYTQRRSEPLNLHVEEYKPVRRAVLLNCLDFRYGHCLLKLLNAQHYLDRRPDLGLIVLVPRYLRWLVPEGVASIWTVDLSLSRGIEWNDWLGQEIHRRIEELEECYLSVAFSHPHPDDVAIEKFTRVTPFPVHEWEERLYRPTVTFIWRGDRLWIGAPSDGIPEGEIGSSSCATLEQSLKLVTLATRLRKRLPGLDFAVAGLGKPGGLPEWILDLRMTTPDEEAERRLCQRYARSHVIIGVHGSSMLLPSAHAGAVIELMPEERWGNALQDLLLRKGDLREALFRCRVLPLTLSVDALCNVVVSLLDDWTGMLLHMQRKWCLHESGLISSAWVEAREQLHRRRSLRTLTIVTINTESPEERRVRGESLSGAADCSAGTLRELGHEAYDFYANDEALQKTWMHEHRLRVQGAQPSEPNAALLQHVRKAAEAPVRHFKDLIRPVLQALDSRHSWFYEILSTQIGHHQPDVLLVRDAGGIKGDFLKEIKPCVRLLVGQVTSTLPGRDELGCYDLVIASSPDAVAQCRSLGVRAELLGSAFDPQELVALVRQYL